MKIPRNPIFAALFIAPGAYAITGWFIMDAKRGSKNFAEMLPLYRGVFGTSPFSFTTLIVALLLLTLIGLFFTGKSIAASALQKSLKVFLLILGSAQTMMLLFSLM